MGPVLEGGEEIEPDDAYLPAQAAGEEPARGGPLKGELLRGKRQAFEGMREDNDG